MTIFHWILAIALYGFFALCTIAPLFIKFDDMVTVSGFGTDPFKPLKLLLKRCRGGTRQVTGGIDVAAPAEHQFLILHARRSQPNPPGTKFGASVHAKWRL